MPAETLEQSTLLSVKQFADITGVSESTLRYYDSIGLFKPIKRGGNNYRYYMPYQMIALNFINVLAGVGIKLEEIKALTKERTPEDVVRLFNEQEKEFTRQIEKLNEARLIVHTFKQNIKMGLSVNEKTIRIEKRKPSPVTFGLPNEWGEHTEFYNCFVEFIKLMDKNNANLIFPVGGYFTEFTEFYSSPSKPAKFFLSDPNGKDSTPCGDFIIAYARGFYGEMNDAPNRILRFAKQNGIKNLGSVYVKYLLDEVSMSERSEYLSEIAVLIKQ